MNHDKSVCTCGTIVDPVSRAVCGTKGGPKDMFYFLLPTGADLIVCPTCKDTLATGFNAAKQSHKFATVATVRSLAGFDIELVPALQVHVGHCSFKACDCKLGKGEVMTLRFGTEYRRICQNCAAALGIISARAANQLTADATSAKKMGKGERRDVTREAKLVPEPIWVAQGEVKALQAAELNRIEAAQRLAQVQIDATTAAAPATPPVQAEPAVSQAAPKLPKNFGSRYRILVEKYGLPQAAFEEALLLAHRKNMPILEAIKATEAGRQAIEARNADVKAQEAETADQTEAPASKDVKATVASNPGPLTHRAFAGLALPTTAAQTPAS